MIILEYVASFSASLPIAYENLHAFSSFISSSMAEAEVLERDIENKDLVRTLRETRFDLIHIFFVKVALPKMSR